MPAKKHTSTESSSRRPPPPRKRGPTTGAAGEPPARRKRRTRRRSSEFEAIFARLKELFQPYADRLTVTIDTADRYHLYAPYHPKYKKAIFFGGVEVRKNYVSYHLIPIYAFPKLLADVSPELKRRNQGKSCFNFTAIDEPLFKDLERLTRRGFELFAPQFIPDSE
jgi:hypothetical protein